MSGTLETLTSFPGLVAGGSIFGTAMAIYCVSRIPVIGDRIIGLFFRDYDSTLDDVGREFYRGSGSSGQDVEEH